VAHSRLHLPHPDDQPCYHSLVLRLQPNLTSRLSLNSFTTTSNYSNRSQRLNHLHESPKPISNPSFRLFLPDNTAIPQRICRNVRILPRLLPNQRILWPWILGNMGHPSHHVLVSHLTKRSHAQSAFHELCAIHELGHY